MGDAASEEERFFPGRALLDAYGNGGFRFAEMSHRGSLLLLPSGIYAWPPMDFAQLSVGDFDKVFAEAEAEQGGALQCLGRHHPDIRMAGTQKVSGGDGAGRTGSADPGR